MMFLKASVNSINIVYNTYIFSFELVGMDGPILLSLSSDSATLLSISSMILGRNSLICLNRMVDSFLTRALVPNRSWDRVE